MVDDGLSSLQRAARTTGSRSSLSKATSQSRGGSKNRGTETSFEIGAPASKSTPTVSSKDTKTQSSYTVSGSSYTGDRDIGTTSDTGVARKSSKGNTKSTQHFTIISAHDEEQHDTSESAMDVNHHHGASHFSTEFEHTVGMSVESTQPSAPPPAQTGTYHEIGGFQEERKIYHAAHAPFVSDEDFDDRPIEQMEGVIDQGSKMPLVVLDGANVAYAYAGVMAGKNNSSLEAASSRNKLEPDVRGIQIATQFFLDAGVRALVVLPQYWFRENDKNRSANSIKENLEILGDLKAKGLIVASPPTDDDDAYALTISRREEMRSRRPPRNGEGPGFVLSNDLFRDAQERDAPNGGTLKEWLTKGRNADIGPGRISYTFGDMGTMNDRGERVLDFIPNPRHPLVIWMESQ